MGVNSAFKPLPANVGNMVSSENANKGEVIFNLAFKGLKVNSGFLSDSRSSSH